ncbi:uncharacterized protein N7477_005840 [Penicillium maclennaniae]|uniref:uncharacterized protein n=1 Tax=Penicillium maclennaniae TaxID=1343394 RepID=UPI0025420E6C|nr:uncharacterized protein N7477_005840 [Penicillium maclennaniae]KAJ5670477.1 hypothetical protein N7477_005840 [Penicillium maclennaniae]
MDVPNALSPKEFLECNKISRVWKPAYVWPADNDGIVRVVGGHDNPNVAEHRRNREWARAMGQEPGPVVNHVVSAITIEEFHHEHFPMVSAYEGLSPMQAEFLDLVPDQLDMSNRSSNELQNPDSDSDLPPFDATLDVPVCTATSPHAIFAFPITPSGPISPGTRGEPSTPVWSAIAIPTHTYPEEHSPADVIVEKLQNYRTHTPDVAPKYEGNCAFTVIGRRRTPNDLRPFGSPTRTSSDTPYPFMPINNSGFVASAMNRPVKFCSELESSTLEVLSSAVYVNSFGSSNTPANPLAADKGSGAMALETNELVSMTADPDVGNFSDTNLSNMDKLMIDPAIADASIVSAAVILPQDDSPRSQKSKGVDESIVEEQSSCVQQQVPSVDQWARNYEKGGSMGPVATWRRSTVRLKQLGRKLLKPDTQEQQFLVACNKTVNSHGNPPHLPPKDDPVTHPKRSPVPVFPTSLGPGEQSLLYSKLEYMVCETANAFLVEQYLKGRIDHQTISRVVNGWAAKNLPRVPEFRFDQATQRDLINANRRTMEFTGKCSANPVQLDANLRAWKSVTQDMNHRTFSICDSAIRKTMYEIGEVLEMLNASVKALQAFDELRTNVHRYMFTPPGSPASPLII